MKEQKGSTMKRRYARLPLALALGAMVLTPAVIGVGASSAEASVDTRGETGITLSGDARLRGFWREDADFADADNTNAQLQHRMRLNLDARAAGGTSLHSRFHLAGDAGNNPNHYTWGAVDIGDNRNFAVDYLYVRVPVGPGTVIAGRQIFNYGHAFRVWEGRGDRLTYSQRINDEVTLFGYYQKMQEAQTRVATVPANATDTLAEIIADDEDRNLYGLGMGYSAGPLTANVQLRHHDQEWSGGDDGTELVGFGTYRLDDLTLETEFHFTTGDLFENAEDDNQHKIYLGAAYQLGDTTFTGGFAYAMAGSTASPFFNKISMFHETGGGHGLGHTQFGAAPVPVEDAMAIGVGASHKLSPELTLGGRLAYTAYDFYNDNPATGSDDASVFSVDASLAYKINASTTYHIDAIYANPDDVTADDDAYYGLSHRLEIRF
ncbi:porin [Desulfurivibrio alkaliphilus]|uniref:Porin domain-containing protein n=1 Tax=Desulfurivibrio alkaliphilus (strain DSM 19089 / UNIQEM U267 / AHT2) TaxID=589865 RepID=D6Z699_DESAT|nr:porin [Desulfurivibrio alkaliphilus]ADH86864.1 hypothetical protein DaAHT2_2199 [Desulfurivibrio alkaliphilus AHT 2]